MTNPPPAHCFVDFLPEGASPLYDKKPGRAAYLIGEDGENILVLSRPQRIAVPLWTYSDEIPLARSAASDPMLRTKANVLRLRFLHHYAIRAAELRACCESSDQTPTLATIVQDMPTVTCSVITIGSGDSLHLSIRARFGMALSWFYFSTENLPGQHPFERFLPKPTDAGYEDNGVEEHPLLQPLSGIAIDWRTYEGRRQFAADVQRKLREDFFGPAILEPC